MHQAVVADTNLTVELGALRRRLESLEALAGVDVPLDLREVERLHIERVLERCRGNRSEAARLLGIDRTTLRRKGF